MPTLEEKVKKRAVDQHRKFLRYRAEADAKDIGYPQTRTSQEINSAEHVPKPGSKMLIGPQSKWEAQNNEKPSVLRKKAKEEYARTRMGYDGLGDY